MHLTPGASVQESNASVYLITAASSMWKNGKIWLTLGHHFALGPGDSTPLHLHKKALLACHVHAADTVSSLPLQLQERRDPSHSLH